MYKMKAAAVVAAMFFIAGGYGGSMICVKSERANIRSGPGIKNPVLWQALKNTPLEVMDKKNGWYRVVDYAGYSGWLHSGLVSARQCVIIKTGTAYVYSKPLQSSYIEWEVDREFPFSVLEIMGNWVKVVGYMDTQGWIFVSDLWGI